jgi:hypothetical protein
LFSSNTEATHGEFLWVAFYPQGQQRLRGRTEPEGVERAQSLLTQQQGMNKLNQLYVQGQCETTDVNP